MAYSEGTDSTLLFKMTHVVLGDKVIAMTAFSASVSVAEYLEDEKIASQIGTKHILVESDETLDPGFAIRNSSPR